MSRFGWCMSGHHGKCRGWVTLVHDPQVRKHCSCPCHQEDETNGE